MAAPTGLRMRMADIADIARVQRPVVTMWRKRPAATGHLFPEPVSAAGGDTWFDADEIAAYLTATGRGNNRTVDQDIAAAAGLADAPSHGAAMRAEEFDAVSALLALRAIDHEGFADQSPEDVLERADNADPDDEFLYFELEVIGHRLSALGEFVDRLVESSYSIPVAMEGLMAQRFRLRASGHSSVVLSADAVDVVTDLVLALADQAKMDVVTVIDPTEGSSDLLVALTQQAEHRVMSVYTPAGASPAARMARRRLRAHGVVRHPFDPDRAPAGSLYIARFPTPANPDMSSSDILSAVNELAVTTSATDRLVVLAPAAVLTDRLPARADRNSRDDLLRTDRLRALVKLPVGLVPGKSRQRLALCCLGPPFDSARGNFVAVGDLPDIRLAGPATHDLAIDLAAAMTPQTSAAHAARYLHLVAVSELRSRHRSLVTSSPTPTSTAAAGAGLAVQFAAIRESLRQPVAAVDLPRVDIVHQPASSAAESLGHAEMRRLVRVRPGHRLDPGVLDESGTVPVIGAPELADTLTIGERRADRLRLTVLNPTVAYTERGDVVFCAAPRPHALVDPGGSVVEAPARILRFDTSSAIGVVPALLAADINRLPPAAKNWKAWPLRRVAPDQAAEVAAVFVALESHHAELVEHLRQLDQLQGVLADGLSSGTLALSTIVTRTDERNTHASTH